MITNLTVSGLMCQIRVKSFVEVVQQLMSVCLEVVSDGVFDTCGDIVW